jgi:predicted dehydrogenase
VKHPDAPELASSRTSAILDYGADVRCCLSVNHHHAYGLRHQASEFRLEGTEGAAVATMGVNLDYPRGRKDALEIARRGGDWEAIELAGSWFPDAFSGTMSNLQRFVAGDDPVLHTSVEDAWHTMALVEACYESDRVGGTPVATDARNPAC